MPTGLDIGGLGGLRPAADPLPDGAFVTASFTNQAGTRPASEFAGSSTRPGPGSETLRDLAAKHMGGLTSAGSAACASCRPSARRRLLRDGVLHQRGRRVTTSSMCPPTAPASRCR